MSACACPCLCFNGRHDCPDRGCQTLCPSGRALADALDADEDA